jgi:hypothetical protein
MSAKKHITTTELRRYIKAEFPHVIFTTKITDNQLKEIIINGLSFYFLKNKNNEL